MPLPLFRYPLDPSGINPDNAVVGEVHELHIRQIRAVAPTHGPFFTQGLVVYDHATNRLLIRGTDYQCVELLQEATVKYGKEIAQLILILDQTVSNEVRISYQVLGGLYQNNAEGIVNMYETAMLDQRPVDWVNVLNKPYNYPPTLHNHLIQDVYGFEYLVVALERIRNAIILSDVPAFEALIAWVKGRTLDTASFADVDSGLPVDKVVTLEKLIYAMDKFNFNSITVTPDKNQVKIGGNVAFKVDVTNMPDNAPLFWTIEHINTVDNDFNSLSGNISIACLSGQFNVSIAGFTEEEAAEQFRVVIRKNSVDGPVLTKSCIITIKAFSIFDVEEAQHANSIEAYINSCCLYNPNISINPESLYIVEDN